MINLFRLIRKSLLESGHFRRYVLYAVGEIALVVIGILIALQINNWNEWRKDRIKEIATLESVSKNLSRNCDLLEESLNTITSLNKSSAIILDLFFSDAEYHDSLTIHFVMAGRNGVMMGLISYEGYEAYKNEGFDIILSDSVKNSILELYEVEYPSIEKFRALLIGKTNNEQYSILSSYFRKYVPLDFASLKQSNEMYERFAGVKDFRRLFQAVLSSSYNESQRVLNVVNEEIIRLK